ncbi:outer membrane protein [Jiella mangrovi]|uniref:Porin family protein n=1 Tax=Jiella mangrovi TaxID=2821407 RepID=A0ABS4BHH8_9HYPH|nr:outer membrane protein [Jiella mangrovi]MBP0616193.1 porin family protein [Jiella mangrovi]
MKVVYWFGAVASLAVICGTNAANAADLSPIYDAPLYQDVPELQPVEIGTGWYLRGDAGYQFKSDLRSSFDVSTPLGTASAPDDELQLQGNAEFSVGFGYKFNEFLRADATFGYWKSDVDNADFSSGDLSVDTEAKAYELMANAYVDLGTYAGFTPYVGAGAGGVQVSYDLECRYGGDDCGSTFDSMSMKGGSDWRFAYSLMAGVSYDVSQNLKIDLGYRFTDVDSGNIGSLTGSDSDTDDTIAASGRDDGFKRHTIQAGLRYSLW